MNCWETQVGRALLCSGPAYWLPIGIWMDLVGNWPDPAGTFTLMQQQCTFHMICEIKYTTTANKFTQINKFHPRLIQTNRIQEYHQHHLCKSLDRELMYQRKEKWSPISKSSSSVSNSACGTVGGGWHFFSWYATKSKQNCISISLITKPHYKLAVVKLSSSWFTCHIEQLFILNYALTWISSAVAHAAQKFASPSFPLPC